MSTDGEKRPYFSRLFNAQGSRRLGPNYRLSKRVDSARAGQPLTAAYLFAPNGYRIAKLVRNAGYGRRSTGARSGVRGVGLLLEQGFEQAPQLAVTCRLASLAQVVGNIQLSCAALSNAGAAHIDVCPSMLDVEALAVGVKDEMPLILVVQDRPSGGPVQLSFQQSLAHLLLRAAKARIIAQGLSECGIMAGPSER